MTNINLLISGAQLLMNILNIKQQLLTGTFHSNTFFKTKEDPEADQAVQLSRSSKEVRDFSSENYYQNPLLNYNSPDPGVVRLEDGSGWALVTTTNDVTRKDNTTAFPIYFSKDLVSWELRGHVFTPNNWPSWSVSRMWAPEIHYVSGVYVVYFTSADKDDKLNIGAAVATSDNPFGRFRDIGSPLISDPNSIAGALDPHYFKDPVSRKHFLLWKEDDPLRPSLIKVRELSRDGLSFVRGSPTRVILSSTLPGERFVTEAPWMMYKDGYYYLFYSSAWFFDEKYHLRVAKAKSLFGPFIKRRLPVLETNWRQFRNGVNTTFVGPGHCSVVTVGDDWWVLYHSWTFGNVDAKPGRLLLLDKIKWQSRWPTIGSPSTARQLKPVIEIDDEQNDIYDDLL